MVDPTQRDNVLLVSAVNDPEMTRVARTMATRVGHPMDRDAVTRRVAPLRHPGLARHTVALVSGLWVASGFLISLAWLVVRWRRRTTAVPGVRPLVLLALACAASSAMVATVLAARDDGTFGTWWLLGTTTSLAAAVATVALDVLFGPVGVALASTFFLFLAGPLFSGRDPRLLPGFWWQVAPWTLHGASQELATSVAWFGSTGLLRPALVPLGLIALSLAALTAAARTHARSQERGEPVAGASWRLRVLAVAIPVALAFVAATFLAPASARVVSALPVPGASETQCVATPKVSTLHQLNEFAGKLRGGSSFQGADVGADVRLQDGRRLWVFGDTLRAQDFRGSGSSATRCSSSGTVARRPSSPPNKGALVPDRHDGIGYWPMSIARVQRRGYDLVGVATQRVKSTGTPDGALAFESLGSSMAVFVVQRGKTPQLLAQQDIGRDDKDPARPEWGAAAAEAGGWVYLYGTARPQQKGVFGFSLRVARTRVDGLLDPSTWRYWDGRTWQRSASRAKQLIAADQGVSQTLSVFERKGRWYAVSKRDEFLGTDLVVWSAPAPTGPFDSGTVVGKLPSDLKSGELRYMPLAHPDLMPDPASVLVSYSRNNTDLKKVEDDPFLYRPQFVRVTLPVHPAH